MRGGCWFAKDGTQYFEIGLMRGLNVDGAHLSQAKRFSSHVQEDIGVG